MPDLSRICDLHQSSQQRRILNPLSEARDQTCVLMDTIPVLKLLSHNRNAYHPFQTKGGMEFPLWQSGNEPDQEP